ncbi:unnamed protein product, partial [Rotaria socialis]
HGISIETIIELARLVLQANAFVYGKKFYRQIIGGAMGSPFTLTLANIFKWKWERQTILSKLPSMNCMVDISMMSSLIRMKMKQQLKDG